MNSFFFSALSYRVTHWHAQRHKNEREIKCVCVCKREREREKEEEERGRVGNVVEKIVCSHSWKGHAEKLKGCRSCIWQQNCLELKHYSSSYTIWQKWRHNFVMTAFMKLHNSTLTWRIWKTVEQSVSDFQPVCREILPSVQPNFAQLFGHYF